jgi:hypothetical protein
MPMGWRFSGVISQTTATLIVAEMDRRLQRRGIRKETHWVSIEWMDSLIFGSVSEEIDGMVTKIFREICREWRVTINETKSREGVRHFANLGVQWDLQNHTWTVEPKWAQNFCVAVQALSTDGALTKREGYKIVGKAAWAAYIMGGPLAQMYAAYRNMAAWGPSKWEEVVSLWESAKFGIDQVHQRLTTGFVSHPIQATRRLRIQTDASKEGWAAALDLRGGGGDSP